MKSQRASMMAVLLGVTPVSTQRAKTALSMVHLTVAILCECYIVDESAFTFNIKLSIFTEKFLVTLTLAHELQFEHVRPTRTKPATRLHHSMRTTATQMLTSRRTIGVALHLTMPMRKTLLVRRTVLIKSVT